MPAPDLHPSIKAIRTTQLGMLISVVLMVAKWLAGHFGHSYALIADATETGADILSSAFLWLGLRISLKPADDKHPYGHGKAEPLAAMAISAFLMVAAAWIGWHAFGLATTPHQLPEKFTLYILIVVILVKEGMFRYVMRIGNEINSTAVKADAYHHRSDAITSVAAFIGIIIALAGGKGYEGADDWAAILASLIILYNAIMLLRPALAEIMDTAPSSEIFLKVKEIAGHVKDVQQIEKCYVRKMGFEYFVDLHIKVDGKLSVEEGHRIAHVVKDALRQSKMGVKDVLIHIEPI